MQRRGALRDAAHAAELQVVHDPLRDGLESVVVAGPAPLRPQVLRLEQRHLDGEEEVFAGDRVVVVEIGHGGRVTQEHEGNIVAVWGIRLTSAHGRQLHSGLAFLGKRALRTAAPRVEPLNRSRLAIGPTFTSSARC